MWHSVHTWRGPLLIAGVAAVVLWLYFSGNLSLYIHPRYHLFTAVMSVIAVCAVVLGSGYLARESDEHDDHESGSKVATGASTLLSVGTLLALVLIPPATLGTTTVDNRAINQTGLGDTAALLDSAELGDATVFSSFTVREWAGILRQTQDPAFFRGKPVDAVGFIAADPENEGVFYLTRFVVSCCSVDAQPVGVPVSLPGWESQFEEETWVRVTGEFTANANTQQTHPLVVIPTSIEPAEQPNEPYLF